jgi:hypothetical protein
LNALDLHAQDLGEHRGIGGDEARGASSQTAAQTL